MAEGLGGAAALVVSWAFQPPPEAFGVSECGFDPTAPGGPRGWERDDKSKEAGTF